MSREIQFTFQWVEERWLQMLFDLEIYVRHQRLKWFLLCWLAGPGLVVGFGGWTALISLRLFGVMVLEPNTPEFWWQAMLVSFSAGALWVLMAWVTRRFFCRMMLAAFRREPAAHAPQSWRIDPEKIHVSTGRGSSVLSWAEIVSVVRTRHGYWLAQAETKGVFLPRFALEDSNALTQFEDLLASHLSKLS